MQYCKRCLYPANHPLGITFDEAGICSGCRVHEEKTSLDWSVREQELTRLFDAFRDRTGKNYDCIVPVTGAKDSYFIIHTVKRIYGMNPLLVCFNKEYNTELGIRNLAYLKTIFDCDCMTYSPNPELLKKLVRATLKKMGSMYWHCLAGMSTFPVQIAARFGIPLIVWGVHQGIDQVGMFSHLDEVEMTEKYRKEHDLMGYDALDLIDTNDGVSYADVEPFLYPSDKDLERVGVRGVYLGNYIPWDAKSQHESMIELYGYEGHEQCRTFHHYEDVDCFHYSGLHDYIKFLKWGYGKVTDHAVREIRWQRMTREQGIAMVEKYQNKMPDDLQIFLRWIGMTESELFDCIDRHRDQRIWKKSHDGKWQLLDSVLNHVHDENIEDARLAKRGESVFVTTPQKKAPANPNQYVIHAKGCLEYPLKADLGKASLFPGESPFYRVHREKIS